MKFKLNFITFNETFKLLACVNVFSCMTQETIWFLIAISDSYSKRNIIISSFSRYCTCGVRLRQRSVPSSLPSVGVGVSG